jgi:murein DD-endopeptidase MepM/ murein hydrolase activator NlpD
VRRPSQRHLPLLLVACLLSVPASGVAASSPSVGAAEARTGPRSGGAEFGQPNGRPSAMHPVATTFRIGPHTITEGTAPRLAVRIDQRGVRTVTARVAFRPLKGASGAAVSIPLGRIRTGRLLHPKWPSRVALKPGRYEVSLHAAGPAGGRLLRRASASGKAPLTVEPKPTPPPPPSSPAAPPVVADPGVTSDGVFPVAGAHTYGGADARFGSGRAGHEHQGQDVPAAEGTPVLAPLAGTVIARDYQASGAGFYVAMDAADGRSFFFAHCQQDTFAVTVGQAVAAGRQLCRVGHTGDATGPHLHFEIWIGGWRRDASSHPVDPLAQLQAWDK